MATVRITMAEAVVRFLAAQYIDGDTPLFAGVWAIFGSTSASPHANTSTGSSPSSQRAMSKSWIVMSRNMPPETLR